MNGRIKYVAITSSRKCYLPLLAVVDASVIIVKITRSGISCYKFMNSNVKCAIHTSTCQCLLTGTSAVHNVGLLNFEGISTKVTLVTLQRKASNRKNIYSRTTGHAMMNYKHHENFFRAYYLPEDVSTKRKHRSVRASANP